MKEPPSCPECGQRLVLWVAFTVNRSLVQFDICAACDHAAWHSEDGEMSRERALEVLRGAGLLDRDRQLARPLWLQAGPQAS